MRLSFAVSGLAIGLAAVSLGQRPSKGPKLQLPPDLKEALERSKSLRFSGRRTVTVVRAGKIETHSEYVTKDGSNLRIEFAKDSPYAGQITTETSDSRQHYFPDKNEIRVYPSFGKRQFEGFRANFRSPRGGSSRIESADGGVIAGLHCTRYQIVDRDNNPIVQIFIEPHCGMITKRVLYDQSGNIAGSYEFVNLTINPNIQPGAFTIRHRGAKVIHPIDELRKQCMELGMPVFTLKGNTTYKLENVFVRTIKGSKVLTQTFGRDDSHLTLFMTKSSLDPSDVRRFDRGELSSHVWTLNGVTLILIGDQPVDRLRALASQVSE